MNFITYISLGFAAIIIIYIISLIRDNKKLENKLREYFGKPPKKTDYDLGSIGTYRLYKSANSDTSRYIDDITWDDLDMDDVFRGINVCLTSVGEEYLYNCLYEPWFEKSNLEVRESFISRLKENPDERFKIQTYLARLGKLHGNGIPDLIYNAGEKLLKFRFVYNILTVMPFLFAGLIFINVTAGAVCLAMSLIINIAVSMKTKRKIETSFQTIRYFSSLIWCCGKMRKTGNMQSESFMIKLQRLFKIFKPLMKKGAGVVTTQNYSDTTSLSVILYGYLDMFFLSGARNYNKVISGIVKHKDQFHELYKTLGEIDMSICVLSFRESLDFYSKPVFHDENCIKFKEIYHPLLSSPVPNSGIIKNNSIITGSNASGKSTFIKTIAINGILAQTIYTCTAREFSLRFSLVMTSMALRDNISDGESYFITEIKSLKRILDKIKNVCCLCFIDEILRGTNTVERIAASAAVLNYLNEKDCLCIVASHDIELAQMLDGKLDNYHFREKITNDGMVFDYKIKHGISNTKNAIKLLRYMNFDSEIIQDAENLADK